MTEDASESPFGPVPAWAKRVSEEIQRKYPPRKMPKRFHVRRGVYRFKTFEDADIWWDKMIADSLAIEEAATPKENR